jgi:hypothetical protein
MLLYKFKTLDNFERIVDLLLTGRLYCARPNELNDPLEGVFGMALPEEVRSASEGTLFERAGKFWLSRDAQINEYRICCFSKTPREILMWSYYGNGHSGICIEGDYSRYANRIEE